MEQRIKYPRISIEIDEDFKHKIRMKAMQEKISVKNLVHNLLSQWLSNDKSGS